MQDEVDLQDFAISDEFFTCHVIELFDLLAKKVVEFVKKEGRHAALLCLDTIIWTLKEPSCIKLTTTSSK